ncbi:MAG: hypothetical protein ABI882_09770 [Acidobacteriota bacterium]
MLFVQSKRAPRLGRTLFIGLVLAFLAITSQAQGLPRPTGMAPKPTPTPQPLSARVWKDPGPVESLDLVGGPGGRDGAPLAPFTFIEENLKGSNPKIKIKDANGIEWSVKWGTEVNAETVAIRLVWAAGYTVEPAYFVPSGKIEGATGLTRAKAKVKEDGSFVEARFERQKDKGVKKLEDEQSWNWTQNPFVGTKELNGLKIMVMLLSNWDNKDVRDVSRGSNTAIFQTKEDAVYLVTDWGASLGKWGSFISREKWDCRGYQSQNKSFVKGVKNGFVEFGYSGQHTKDFSQDIKVSDVQWLMQTLGKLSDEQLKSALEAGGTTPDEQICFTKAIRERIERLRGVK